MLPATVRRLKARLAPMTAVQGIKPVSAPLPITANGAVRNIMPPLAGLSAKRLIRIIAAIAATMTSAMAVKAGGATVLPNANALIMTTAATATIIMPVMDARDIGMIVLQSVKSLIMIIAETDHLFQFRQMLIAVLFTAIAAANVLPGHVIQDIQNRETVVLFRQMSEHLYLVTEAHPAA